MKSLIGVVAILALIFSMGCSESLNKLSRSTDNLTGIDAKVSYISDGKVVKTWTLKNSKITSGKDEAGRTAGYYYFWDENNRYVQLPINNTIIEEVD